MIFKRYSSPFLLLDNLILTNQLSDFINTLNDKFIEEIDFEIWLHKGYDISFDEFRKNVRKGDTAQSTLTKDDIKTTVTKSFDMLSNFKP